MSVRVAEVIETQSTPAALTEGSGQHGPVRSMGLPRQREELVIENPVLENFSNFTIPDNATSTSLVATGPVP